jgi:hypothetical protein
MALVNDCCCGASCVMKKKCGSQHQCAVCDGFMHAICGHDFPEEDPKWSIWYGRVCHGCHSKPTEGNNNTNDNNDPSSEDDIVTLASLAVKRLAKAPPPASQPKKKKEKRKARPEATYVDDPSVDPSNWSFPADRPEYLTAFLEFMSFVDNKKYTKVSTFTKEQLMSLQPKHVLAFLTHKTFSG